MWTAVMDSCDLIAYFRKEDGVERINRLFEMAIEEEVVIYLHKVSLAEVAYDALRSNQNKTPRQIINDIEKLPIIFDETLSEELIVLVASFKVNYRVSFADCFVLALAKLHNAKVITSDHHEFDAIDQSGELQFEWIR